MAPPRLAERHVQTEEPQYAMALSVTLAMLSQATLAAFLAQRYLAVKTPWTRLPLVQWLVFAIYVDSSLFVLATAVLQFGFGVSYSASACETAILLCLICYVTTKLIYMFLVEKAYIIRSSNKKPRLSSKLYLFNSFGMIGAYCVVVVPNFVFRISKVENGECIIGMERPAMIPLIVFDLIVNIYLTIIFLKPLSNLYSYKNVEQAPSSRRLRTISMRTFVGCTCTLISSIVNLSVLVGLDGEPGWICLICCNTDILFSAIVIHWVTSKDDVPDDSPNTILRSLRNAEEFNSLPNHRSARHSLASRFAENMPGSSSGPNKSHLTLTTTEEEMIVDAAKLSHSHSDQATVCGDSSPSCTSNKTFRCESKQRLSILSTDENQHQHQQQDEEEEVHEMPRLPPMSAGSGMVRHPVPEVRVDIDYGTSLSMEGEDGDVKMGNTTWVGKGDGGVGSGRGSPWGR